MLVKRLNPNERLVLLQGRKVIGTVFIIERGHAARLGLEFPADVRILPADAFPDGTDLAVGAELPPTVCLESALASAGARRSA